MAQPIYSPAYLAELISQGNPDEIRRVIAEHDRQRDQLMAILRIATKAARRKEQQEAARAS